MIRVARAEDFNDPREPPLGVGARVRLNSGGPVMMIVDIHPGGGLTCAWETQAGRVSEAHLLRPMVHRARDLK